jgi:hypothetical protein
MPNSGLLAIEIIGKNIDTAELVHWSTLSVLFLRTADVLLLESIGH